MLRAVYERPRQIKWFVGLQILGAAMGIVLVAALSKDLGLEIGRYHSLFLLFFYLATKGFLVWKIWTGRNRARLTMLAWFLYTYIRYFIPRGFGVTQIPVAPIIKIGSIGLAILQVSSLALLFVPRANEWFRPAPAKESLLFPR